MLNIRIFALALAGALALAPAHAQWNTIQATAVQPTDMFELYGNRFTYETFLQAQQAAIYFAMQNGSIGAGTIGQIPFYAAAGNVLTAEGPFAAGAIVLGAGTSGLTSQGPFAAGTTIIGNGSSGVVAQGPFSAGALVIGNGASGLTANGPFSVDLPVLGNGAAGVMTGTLSGTGTKIATVSGSPVNGNCASWNSGNLVDSGVAGCSGSSGGSGTVTTGTTNQIATYPSNGTTVAGTQALVPTPQISMNSTGLTLPGGTRGDLFIWDNCANNAAGQNCGEQIWLGSNPTATPGATNPIALTIGATNGGGRTGAMWAINSLTITCGPADSAGCSTGAGFFPSSIVGYEDDMGGSSSFTYNNDAFNPTNGGSVVGNGIEVYSQGSGKLTAAYSAWSTSASNLWSEGVNVARASTDGFHCTHISGDTQAEFTQGCFRDNSSSTFVFDITGTHTSVFNFFDETGGIPPFVQGSSHTDTGLFFTTPGNFNMSLNLSSGNTTEENSEIDFSDRGTIDWAIRKNTSNNFVVLSFFSGNTLLDFTPIDGVVVGAASKQVLIQGGVTLTGLGGLGSAHGNVCINTAGQLSIAASCP